MDIKDLTKVYKAMIGGYKEADDKHEGTHVLLSLEQFHALIADHKRQIEEFTRTIGELERRLKQSESSAKSIANSEKAFKAYAREEIEKAKAREKAAKDQAGFEVEQMKRILRDHANKERNIPRRAPGYMIVDIEEYEGGYKSTVSTPWPLDMDLDMVKKYCFEEQFGGLFRDFTVAQSECANERIYRLNGKSRYNANGMANGPVVYRIYFRTGKSCWECRISHYGYVRYGTGGRRVHVQQEE